MKNLITLVKMQLKEKLNLKSLELKKPSAFQILVTAVFALLKIAVITAIFAVLLFLINYTGIKTSAPMMSLVFGIMLIASIFSCTAGLTKAMYFSNDNAILLTLPCKPLQVFLSKLIIFFAYEFKRNLNFMVPLFFAYFIISGYPIGAYPWLVLCIALVSLFTVALGTILSIPVMWVSSIFRQRRSLQIATMIVLIFAVAAALFYLVSLIPDTLDLRARWPVMLETMEKFLENTFVVKFSFYYNLTLVFLGEITNAIYITFPIGATAVRYLTILGVTAGLFILGLVAVLPLFYKMASTPFEYLKKAVKAKKNRVTHRSLTTFVTELIATIKNPARAYSNVGVMLSTPLLIFLLNKIFFAMNTNELGENLVIGFNVMIILLLVLNTNASAASIYSRDGRAAYLIKVQPTHPRALLFSKLLPDAMFCIISLIGTFAILLVSSNLGFMNSLFMILGIICIYVSHLMYSAELDLLNPQYEIYATVGASDSNPNETKSTLSAFIVSFLVAIVVVILLLDKSAGIDVIKISDSLSLKTVYLKLFLLALGYAIYRVCLYFSTIKLYYKEN